MTDRAIPFNIWREAQRHDGDLTVAELVEELGEPERRVTQIVRKRGWVGLFWHPQAQWDRDEWRMLA